MSVSLSNASESSTHSLTPSPRKGRQTEIGKGLYKLDFTHSKPNFYGQSIDYLSGKIYNVFFDRVYAKYSGWRAVKLGAVKNISRFVATVTVVPPVVGLVQAAYRKVKGT